MKMKNLLQFSLGVFFIIVTKSESQLQRPSPSSQITPGLVQPYQANSFSNPNYVSSINQNQFQNTQNQRPQIQPIRQRDPENPELPATIKFPSSTSSDSKSVQGNNVKSTLPDREARELSSSADTSSYYRSTGGQRQVAQTQDSRHLFSGNWGWNGGIGGGYNGGGGNGGGYNGGNREKPGTCYRGGGFGSGSGYNQNNAGYYSRRSDDDTAANTIDAAGSAISSTGERIKRESGYGYSSGNSGGYGGGGGYSGSGYNSGGGYYTSSGGGYNPGSGYNSGGGYHGGNGYNSGGGYHGGNGIYPTTTYRPGFGSSYCRRSDYECPGNQKCCSGICTNPATVIG